MSGQVSRGSAGEYQADSGQVSRGSARGYQADERAGVAGLSWRVSKRLFSSSSVYRKMQESGLAEILPMHLSYLVSGS